MTTLDCGATGGVMMFGKLQCPLLIFLLILIFLTINNLNAYEPVISVGKPRLYDILYSPDGRFLATLTTAYLELLDAETFAPVSRVSVDGDGLAFSKDGSLLAIFGQKAGIYIWHVDSETFLATMPVRTDIAAFSPDGKFFAYANEDSVFLWDIERKEIAMELTGDPNPLLAEYVRSSVFAIAFHPNSRILAVASARPTIALWDTQTGEIASYLETKDWRSPKSVIFIRDGASLAVVGRASVKLVDIDTGDSYSIASAHGGDVIFSPDEKRLLVGTGEGILRIVDTTTLDVEKRQAVENDPPFEIGNSKRLERLTFHPDAGKFACLINGSRITIWDGENFSKLETLYGWGGTWYVVCLPEINRIVTGSYTDVLCFWDMTTGELVDAVEFRSTIGKLKASPDGRKIGFDAEAAVQAWDAVTAEPLYVFEIGAYAASIVEFSPSGRYLASYGWGGSHIWDTETWEESAPAENDWGGIKYLRFTHDEREIVKTQCDEGKTGFWNIETGELSREISNVGLMENAGTDFVQARQVGDSIEIYMLKSGKRLCRIPDIPEIGDPCEAFYRQFHPSGNVLAVRYGKTDAELQGYTFYNSHTGELLATVSDVRYIDFAATDDYIFMVDDHGQSGLYRTSDVLGKPVSPVFTVHAFDKITTFGQIKQDQLLQNYPNPFNPETWIPYQLKTDSATTITIYDSIGQIVKALDLGHKKSGYHTVHWDGKDDRGQSLASGIYFYVLRANDGFSDTRKMVLLR